jgi:hypothetical protein
MAGRFLVLWDFVAGPGKRTPQKFYDLLRDEFAGDAERVQRSCYVCRSAFVAHRLKALAESFGADVLAYGLSARVLDDAAAERRAAEYVDQLLRDRRKHRGPVRS